MNLLSINLLRSEFGGKYRRETAFWQMHLIIKWYSLCLCSLTEIRPKNVPKCILWILNANVPLWVLYDVALHTPYSSCYWVLHQTTIEIMISIISWYHTRHSVIDIMIEVTSNQYGQNSYFWIPCLRFTNFIRDFLAVFDGVLFTADPD